MDRFHFRIHVASDQWSRLRRRLEYGQGGSPLIGRLPGDGVRIAGRAVPMAVPVLCVLLIGAALDPSGARVKGVAVQGSRILVVEDDSGSMNTAATAAELARQKAALGSALFADAVKAKGFGVISTGADVNLLHVLQRALADRRGVDTVYVFSDFYPGTREWDCNDPPGLAEFRSLIRSAGVRLYLSTVNMLPSPGLLAIARESGGQLVGLAGAADSLNDRRRMCKLDE